MIEKFSCAGEVFLTSIFHLVVRDLRRLFVILLGNCWLVGGRPFTLTVDVTAHQPTNFVDEPPPTPLTTP